MNKRILAWIMLFSCNLMWALQFTSIKLTQAQVGPYMTVWGPMLLSLFLLAPFVVKDFKQNNRTLKDILAFLPLAALGAFPSQVLMTIGTRMSLASNAAILVLILPVLTAVLAFILLKEKMTKIRWICFGISIIGVVLCSTNDIKQMNLGSEFALGNLIIILALIGNAYYNVGCKKIAVKFTGMEMVFYTYLFVVILLTPFVAYYENDTLKNIGSFTTETWIGMGSLTLFQNFLSMVLFFIALKNLEATEVALSNYLITFFGLPIAAIWLHEKLGSQAIIGGILVLASMLLLTIVENKKKPA
ncbi:MAG: DMT family transporter [Chitinophagaceae bacterium]|uniref:DMT family transporter n=1 Tax=unclassified Paraflavitalea TaxID=2798305 RepID=UPI003D356393|nr:DMT family transporter [Chitinophagaceae bacterium]